MAKKPQFDTNFYKQLQDIENFTSILPEFAADIGSIGGNWIISEQCELKS
jgi:hypothetical protein